MGIYIGQFLYKGTNDSLSYYCPGCQGVHMLNINPSIKPSWRYNDKPECPSFVPSVNVSYGHYTQGTPQPPNCEYCNEAQTEGHKTLCGRCHSYVTDGQIHFLSDCTHELSGKTVPMVPFPKIT